MSRGVKLMHLPETDAVSRSVNGLRASVLQIKGDLDNGVSGTLNCVTAVRSTEYAYRELTFTDGILTAIGDEQTGVI